MDDELHTLTGAHAVHALPRADLAPFEAHLSRCPACTREVRLLRETAARLALPLAVPPPPALRPRILAALRTIPQELAAHPPRRP
jgi:anti-sigma factor RsiW